MKRNWKNIPAICLSALWILSLIFISPLDLVKFFNEDVLTRDLNTHSKFFILMINIIFFLILFTAFFEFKLLRYPRNFIIWAIAMFFSSLPVLNEIFYQLNNVNEIRQWFTVYDIEHSPILILLIIPMFLIFVLLIFPPSFIEKELTRFPIIITIILIFFVSLSVTLILHNNTRIQDGRGGKWYNTTKNEIVYI